ncbi:unnamed protein product [Prorocentrum cordatum]|uniref:mRNA (guanine-N(7)-)-methyltransferase n=1 Tax=Prorocentrum cordatum TaxID=2364126 RepID=A0ABN9SUL0_9DINO|nr:unnamed protein product [Polarella glacialis]
MACAAEGARLRGLLRPGGVLALLGKEPEALLQEIKREVALYRCRFEGLFEPPGGWEALNHARSQDPAASDSVLPGLDVQHWRGKPMYNTVVVPWLVPMIKPHGMGMIVDKTLTRPGNREKRKDGHEDEAMSIEEREVTSIGDESRPLSDRLPAAARAAPRRQVLRRERPYREVLRWERPYREMPLAWVRDQLQGCGLRVEVEKEFPRRLNVEKVFRAIEWAEHEVDQVEQRAVRAGLEQRLGELRARAEGPQVSRALERGHAFGVDYALLARRPAAAA